MTSTTNTYAAQIVPFPNRTEFDPELTKRDLARVWRCSTKTIERYIDPDYTRPRGLRPLPSFTTRSASVDSVSPRSRRGELRGA